jgi:outer membrane lipoprotein
VALALLSIVLGCATGISRETRLQVTYEGTFTALQKAPANHTGEIVMFGGKVIEAKSSPTSSEITVLQLPVDTRHRPKDGDRSEGRYIIRSDQFLDPAIYQAGTLLTVVGKMTGSELRSIGGFQYVYPLVEAIEIKPWPAGGRKSPSFHFGIGVGTWL